ncbi:MAG: hypothetical protein PHT48_09560 [Dechloromonas sp.]|nr:hypothetical protein [Dechloromonas sp.]
MTPTFEIKVDQAKVDRVHFLLSDVKNGAQLALMRSINNTLIGARTLTAKMIGQKATLKSADIKARIFMLKARMNWLNGRLSINGAPVFATEYKHTIKKRGGISVKYYKDEKALQLRHGFPAEMNSGYEGIFLRDREKSSTWPIGKTSKTGSRMRWRLPINEIMGPSVMTLYENTPGISEAVETEASARLLREMESQVNYILEKHK